MPYVPEALPRVSPEAFFEASSEHATCFRVPSENPSLPDSSRTCHVSPNTPSREDSSGSRPNLPSVPECLNSKLPPGALRATTCPETHPGRIPNTSRKPRMRCEPECRVKFPRMISECDTCPEPQTTRVLPGSPANHPQKTPPPGHSASAPRVPAAFSSAPNSRKSNKMFRASKIHRNSKFGQKNPKPIFTVR